MLNVMTAIILTMMDVHSTAQYRKTLFVRVSNMIDQFVSLI